MKTKLASVSENIAVGVWNEVRRRLWTWMHANVSTNMNDQVRVQVHARVYDQVLGNL
jgi:L-arabinose isomerase